MRFKVTKVWVGLFLLLSIFGSIFVFAGLLKQTVYSPYGIQVSENSAQYVSSTTTSPTNTRVDERYKDFQIGSNVDSIEPFCKFGGQYNINVYNDPRPGNSVLNKNYTLYYCKTTADLIKNIRIPKSWVNDNLILYCNDGGNIFYKTFNLDFLTSNINTYKACVLKDLSLPVNNTVLYGFDVGNKMIDSFSQFFFDNITKKGPVLAGLKFNRSNGYVVNPVDKKLYFHVPYVKNCNADSTQQASGVIISKGGNENGNGNDQFCTYEPMDKTQISDFAKSLCKANKLNCVDDSVSQISINQDLKYSYVSINVIVDSKLSSYFYTDDNGFNYTFDYDNYSAFYSLRDFREKLDTPLSDVFTIPDDFGISRVALFRSNGGNVIYGFESAEKLMSKGAKSILPVYKIVGLQKFGFNYSICKSVLSSFDIGTQIGTSSVVCRLNGDIWLNSNVLDGLQNKNGEQGRALTLFKNIILGLKNVYKK